MSVFKFHTRDPQNGDTATAKFWGEAKGL